MNGKRINMQEQSAGILVYRINQNNQIEVLLGKNGGPAWSKRDYHAWNIPKGHIENEENMLDAAIREFEEETGLVLPKSKILDFVYIGNAKTSKNKKVVHIFAFNYDYCPNQYIINIHSNMCQTEYPKNSGIFIEIPELAEAKYININIAKNLIFPYQKIFLERLEKLLGEQNG